MSNKSISDSCSEKKGHTAWSNAQIKNGHGGTRVKENIFCKTVANDFNSAESFEDFLALDEIEDIPEPRRSSKDQYGRIYQPIRKWLSSQVGQLFDEVFSKFKNEFGDNHEANYIFEIMMKINPEYGPNVFFKDEGGVFREVPKRDYSYNKGWKKNIQEAQAWVDKIKAPSSHIEKKGETYRWIGDFKMYGTFPVWRVIRQLTTEETKEFLTLPPEIRKLIEGEFTNGAYGY